MKTTITTILFVALAATGCKKKADNQVPAATMAGGTGSASTETKPGAAAATPAAAAAAADLPASTDFEDKANKDITADNLDSQLSDLEKDLSK